MGPNLLTSFRLHSSSSTNTHNDVSHFHNGLQMDHGVSGLLPDCYLSSQTEHSETKGAGVGQ